MDGKYPLSTSHNSKDNHGGPLENETQDAHSLWLTKWIPHLTTTVSRAESCETRRGVRVDGVFRVATFVRVVSCRVVSSRAVRRGVDFIHLFVFNLNSR